MPKRLYLIRHGETLFNTQKRVQGWCDSSLTQKGIQQAKESRDWFKIKGVDRQAIYASTQERAGDTAQIVSGRSDIIRLKGLKEMNFGIFEAQPEYLNPPLHKDGTGYRDAFVFFGGEDTMAVRRRMVETVTNLMEGLEEGSQVLAVSHGAAIAQFFRGALEEAPDVRGMSNCAILKFTYDQGQFNMHYIYNPTPNEYIYRK